jgi:hypothetical protein
MPPPAWPGLCFLGAHLPSARNVSLGAVYSIANGYDCSMPVIRKKSIEQATIAVAALFLALIVTGILLGIPLK